MPEHRIHREEALDLVAERAAATGFFFDFDGVLAPIAEDPEQVYPADGVVDEIARLGRRVGRVVIVSARPVEFLRDRLPLRGAIVYGLYGLEVIRSGAAVEVDPVAEAHAGLIAELLGRARAELPASVRVEDKRLSVALHYRAAPAMRDTVQRWAAARATEHGLRTQDGRMVVELKPPGEHDKGTVVAAELDGLSSAWYFGDDLSDLRAFAALDAREAEDPGFRGVRVAVANPETGTSVGERADLLVESTAELLVLLRAINAHVAR